MQPFPHAAFENSADANILAAPAYVQNDLKWKALENAISLSVCGTAEDHSQKDLPAEKGQHSYAMKHRGALHGLS
jgi:hypothetical protein